MIVLGLALRLARAGGRLRAALVAAGCALGTLVLLVTLAVPSTQPHLDADDRRLLAVVVADTAVPVVSLLAAVSRLSAGVRDRRLATLRTLGVSAGATRAAAGAEAAVQAALGVVVGVAAFLALRPSLARWDADHHGWFHGRDLAPSVAGWAFATLGVVAVCLAVAVLPAREVTRDPLAVSRRASAAPPRTARVVPLLLGIALLVWPVVTEAGAPLERISAPALVSILAGVLLTGVGVPLAVPVLVRRAGDLLVRTGRPVLTVAGRRMQQEPASGTRLVATLLAAVYVVVGARCVVTAFEQTPQARSGHRVAVTGPQYLDVAGPDGTPLSAAHAQTVAARLASVDGVRRTAVHATVDVDCAGGALGREAAVCERAEVVACRDLPVVALADPACPAGSPVWLSTWSEGAGALERPTGVALVVTAGDPTPRVVARAEIPGDLPVRPSPDLVDEGRRVLVVPPGWAPLRSLGTLPEHVAVEADAGSAVQRRLDVAAARLGAQVVAVEDTSDWDAVKDYRDLLLAVGGALLSLALLALLVTAADAAVSRRRHLAALASVGAPARLAATAQVWQVAVPTVLGTATAGLTGLLAGAAYLTLDGARGATPWGDAMTFTAAVAGGAVLVAAAAALGVRRTRPQDLRRE